MLVFKTLLKYTMYAYLILFLLLHVIFIIGSYLNLQNNA